MTERVKPGRASALLLTFAASILLVAACGGDDEDDGEQTAATEQTATEQTTATGDQGGLGNAGAGEAVFAENCATCHGESGEGGTAPSLQESDLAQDPEGVLEQIREGGGGMPAFGDQLSDQEIADVGAYVTQVVATQ